MSKANASADEKELGRVSAWESANGDSPKKLSPSTTGYHAPRSLENAQIPRPIGFTAGAGHKSRDFATFIHRGLCEGRVGQVRKAFSPRRLPII